jgi:CHAT domain-containing protein
VRYDPSGKWGCPCCGESNHAQRTVNHWRKAATTTLAPGAEQEAKAIAPLLNTKPLIGKDATKIAIEQLMPKARIIHLATHGLLDDVRGIGKCDRACPIR